MEDVSTNRFPPQRFAKKELVVTVLICILVVSGLGYMFYTGITLAKKDIVGIIKIEGAILTSLDADRYTDIINQAILNESVKAVVLVIDSPGGEVRYVEQVYLDLLELRKKKPVVASVITALSGGYYIAMAADYLYVHPTSLLGSIGVIGFMPYEWILEPEWIIETGPYKFTGFSTLLAFYNISHALDNFLSAVEIGRGDRLRLSTTELKRAMIYLGSEAVGVGLADQVGSLQKAIAWIAQMGGLERYEVEELRSREPIVQASWSSSFTNRSLDWRNLTVETLNMLHPPPAIYYLYLPPETLQSTSQPPPYTGITNEIAEKRGVIIDLAHGNMISWWHMDILIAELAKRNVTVSFISNWKDLDHGLDDASALIVASPTATYLPEERDRVEKFVDDGGLLLLFFDPSFEHIGAQGLEQGVIAPMNSLSTKFGISFAKGYLYNEVEHFGIYRNIYVKNFTSSPLTQGLTSLVLFMATNIRSTGNGVAWTSNNTYSYIAERADNYAVIVLAERGKGRVAAFGDLTFLREPYCTVEDNYKLILNIVSLITEARVPVEDA